MTGAPHCPACGCPVSAELGSLGRLAWYRCRGCGIDHYEDSPQGRPHGMSDYYERVNDENERSDVS